MIKLLFVNFFAGFSLPCASSPLIFRLSHGTHALHRVVLASERNDSRVLLHIILGMILEFGTVKWLILRTKSF
jgi:hypothetical protein